MGYLPARSICTAAFLVSLCCGLTCATSLAEAETDSAGSMLEGDNAQAENQGLTAPSDDSAAPETAAAQAAELQEIITDLSVLPFPVRKMRELILDAAYSGDVEKLRPYIGYGDDVTMLSLGGMEQDPIEFLKSISGDAEGHEILAIITEILEAPAIRFEYQPDNYVYVWPYYYAYPFEELTPEQRVQLFRIITYGDYEEMVAFGNYIFYRLGITPEGRWRFFVAGD